MTDMLEFLVSGIIFGFAAGTSAGPLLALVFSETLKYGKNEGIKVAVSIPITELPISLFVLFIVSRLMEHGFILGIISLFGACYLIYLGIKNLRVRTSVFEGESAEDSLKRGVIVNLLNPNPYLFWLSIGGPMLFKSFDAHASAPVLFIVGFYSLLIGSNICIALVVEKSRSFIERKFHHHIVRALGIALIVFALILIRHGFEFMGIP